MVSVWRFFTDPVLQAPTIGCILMCLASSLVGVIVVLRRRSLLGEALSHAAYPGVVLSAAIMAALFSSDQTCLPWGVLICATITSLLGLWLIELLERRFFVRNDSALCFVLSFFFGIGILMASRLQVTHALWYKSVQIFLFGQAATMTDVHILTYALLALVVVATVVLFFKQIQMAIFDRAFAQTVGISLRLLDGFLFALLVLAIVIGIRSVGVVLMAGMLIAPAVAARQFTHRLGRIFVLAGCIGAFSGFSGNYLSVCLPEWGNWTFSLPTGPMILLSASSIAVAALFFAPQNGLISRLWRAARFREQCREENLLKFLWKKGEDSEVKKKSLGGLFLMRLMRQGWLENGSEGCVRLTKEGWKRATHIVRLHRLWEAYLVHLGQGVEKVHRSAEEMEHIITPDLERQLTELLGDPKQDPHAQPIPSKVETLL